MSACSPPGRLILVGANNFVNMEDEGWESEVEEEEAEDHDDEDEEDARQRVKSVSFPTNSQSCISANSPFRLSNFPRAPYYR